MHKLTTNEDKGVFYCEKCAHLAADAQMAVGNELRLVMVVLGPEVHVQHAHRDPGQSHHKRQDFPGLGYMNI